eukprot:g15631.t1
MIEQEQKFDFKFGTTSTFSTYGFKLHPDAETARALGRASSSSAVVKTDVDIKMTRSASLSKKNEEAAKTVKEDSGLVEMKSWLN